MTVVNLSSPYRVAGVCLTAMLVLSGLSLPVAAASQPSDDQPSPVESIYLLAGDASWLVYAEAPDPATPSDPYSGTVVARSTAGASQTLEHVKNSQNSIPQDPRRWSAVGNSITTNVTNDDGHHVQWWDLGRGISGHHTMSAQHTWVGSSPSGWSFTSTTGAVATQQTDLATENLHDPFGAKSGTAVVGPAGVLVHKGGDAGHDFAFLPWAHPTHPPRLHSAATSCAAFTGTAAVCVHDKTYEDAPVQLSHVLMPLDGSAAVDSHADLSSLNTAATSSQGAFVVPADQSADPETLTAFVSFLSVSGTVTHSANLGNYPRSVVSAYGAVVYTDINGNVVAEIASAKAGPTELFRANPAT